MSEIVRKVVLHGALKEYGEEHEIVMNNIGDFFSYASRNLDKIDDVSLTDVIEAGEFQVIVSDGNGYEEVLTDDTIHLSFGEKDLTIDIIPVLEGDKDDVTTVVVGAVMIGVGLYTGQAWLVQAGIGVAAGGVSAMLSPTPYDGTGEEGSSIYTGGINQTQPGVAIPLVYGDTMCGSVQASFGIDVTQWNKEEA